MTSAQHVANTPVVGGGAQSVAYGFFECCDLKKVLGFGKKHASLKGRTNNLASDCIINCYMVLSSNFISS